MSVNPQHHPPSSHRETSSNPKPFRSALNKGFRGLRGNFQQNSGFVSSNTTLLPDLLPLERRLEKHSSRLSQIRVTPLDVQRVTNDPEQFTKLQESLRLQMCMTDAYIRQTYNELIKARVKEMKPFSSERVSSKEPALISLTSEAVPNKFVSLQTQPLKAISMNTDMNVSCKNHSNNFELKNITQSIEEIRLDNDQNFDSSTNASPTSVAVCITFTPEQVQKIKVAGGAKKSVMDIDDSEDDDIQSQSDLELSVIEEEEKWD